MTTTPDAKPSLELREVLDFARYCVDAVLRRRKLAAACLVVVLGASLVVALGMPKKYSVAVRILTKRSYIIPSLVNPQRRVPLESDSPTRGAVESILSYSFREELLDATNLPEIAAVHRSRFDTLRADLDTMLHGAVDPRKIRAGLVELLGRSLDARLEAGGVLHIVASWGNPVVAHKLAEELVDLFLRRQRAAELDEIHDTVDIIQRNVERAHARLTETTTRLGELVKRKEAELTRRLTVRETRERRSVSFRRPAAATPTESGTREARLSIGQQVRAKERELRNMLDQHQQRLARAEANLTRLQESLGPRHPDLQAATRELEDARPIPKEVATLQAEIAELRTRRASAPQGGGTDDGVSRFEVVLMPLSENVYNALLADPEVSHMMEDARKYATEYAAELDRLEAAELEIELSNAEFPYRYTVTQPPVFPIHPVSSKRKLVMAAGLMVGLFLALFLCVALDLASGRLRARWQVERLIGSRVLGRVRLED